MSDYDENEKNFVRKLMLIILVGVMVIGVFYVILTVKGTLAKILICIGIGAVATKLFELLSEMDR